MCGNPGFISVVFVFVYASINQHLYRFRFFPRLPPLLTVSAGVDIRICIVHVLVFWSYSQYGPTVGHAATALR